MQTSTEKIEHLMFIYWDTPKSPKLYAFADKILEAKIRGDSRVFIKRQVASYQRETLGRDCKIECEKIMIWLDKVVAGNA